MFVFSMFYVFVSSTSLFAIGCVLSVFNWLCFGCFQLVVSRDVC
jgi:hypothetical protein